MKRVMLDLETLGTRSDSVITSIGAVYFDTNRQELGPEFYVEIVDEDDAQIFQYGRTVSTSSIRWWMQQGALAKLLFTQKPGQLNTVDALYAFSGFVTANGGVDEVWANGASFDPVILTNLYEAVGIARPFEYQHHRCFRTLKNLNPYIKIGFDGVEHNALDDAKYQARVAMRLL